MGRLDGDARSGVRRPRLIIAVNANILLYAHRSDSSWHAAAWDCVARLAAASRPWEIPLPCIHEFLAIATHARVFDPPTPQTDALRAVDTWLDCPTLRLLAESEDYWPVLRPMVERSAVAGPRIHDARIAALCLQHGATELWTADRDFGRFSGLRTTNPVA